MNVYHVSIIQEYILPFSDGILYGQHTQYASIVLNKIITKHSIKVVSLGTVELLYPSAKQSKRCLDK